MYDFKLVEEGDPSDRYFRCISRFERLGNVCTNCFVLILASVVLQSTRSYAQAYNGAACRAAFTVSERRIVADAKG